ncbi:MAG: cytochrome c biogenesis CcdA family protein [Nocardioidaceae bacterium]
MIDWLQQTVQSGSLLLAVPIALAAGLVSFASPCVVPLLPGYLSYVTGLSAADLADRQATGAGRGRLLAGTVLFVLGFSAVFVSLGTFFGAAGFYLLPYQRTISVVMGLVVIALGLAFMGFVPALNRDVRIHRVPAVGLAAAPLLGALFGLGWTPCIGPTLAVVLTLSGTEGTAGRGALLTLFYCLGLGIPFVLVGLGYRWSIGAVSWVRAHQRTLSYVGGGLLVAVGVLLLTGAWDALVFDLRGWVGGFQTVI